MKRTSLSLSAGLALALLSASAVAQTAPPVLNPPPAVPAVPAAPSTVPGPPNASPPTNDEYLLGRTYRVETVQGTTFTGTLVSLNLTALEFDSPELGHVKLERVQIRRADLQGPAAAGLKPGYFDIGNGNRLFFAPTGRGLRKGEATLQDVNLYLVGLNYGVTNNLSLGGYVSLIPGLALSEQLVVLTPKFSFPLHEKLHVGAGLLYLRVPVDFNGSDGSIGAGIGYGALTYGSADDNLTFGIGYGFVEGDIGSTPVFQVGGQTRVSRRVSLISENYLIADAEAGMGGLYGIKINWRRTSLGLGAAYVLGYGTSDIAFTTYILPVYWDFTFRFGKGAK